MQMKYKLTRVDLDKLLACGFILQADYNKIGMLSASKLPHKPAEIVYKITLHRHFILSNITLDAGEGLDEERLSHKYVAEVVCTLQHFGFLFTKIWGNKIPYKAWQIFFE